MIRTRPTVAVGLLAVSQGTAVLNLVIGAVTAWSMPPTMRGALVVTIGLDEASTSLARLGLPEVLSKFCIEKEAGQGPLMRYALGAGIRTLPIATFFGIATLAVCWRDMGWPVAVCAGFLVALSPIVGMPGAVGRSLLIADGRVIRSGLFGLLSPSICVAVFLALGVGGVHSAVPYVAVYSLASIGASAGSALSAISGPNQNLAPFVESRAVSRQATPLAFAGLADAVNAKGDQLFVGLLASNLHCALSHALDRL